MRTHRPLALALLLPLAALAPAACATGGTRTSASGGEVGATDATLVVRNDYIGPLTLYGLNDGGFAIRLGQVQGTGPERFRIPGSLLGAAGTVRIVAVPLAENGRASTGQLVLRPGDTVQFNISPDLAASSVFLKR